MKLARTVGANALRIEDAPIPVPGAGQVAVKMLSVGICASDVQVYHGKHKYAAFPLVQGHEGIGVVEAAGSGVSHVRKGDKVVIQQQFACGTCYACRKGRHNVCVHLRGVGILADGLFSEYFLSPAWNVIPVPASLGNDRGVFAEPASVGVNAARVAGIKPGERAAVIGAGIIGNLTAQACLALGAADVLVADIADAKLDVARENGIPHCVNAAAVPLERAVADAFGADSPPDAVFDCAGSPASVKSALAVAPNASRVVIVANFKEPIAFDIPSFQRREVAILGVMGTVKETTVEAVEFLASGKIGVKDMITKRFRLEEMEQAYRYIDDNADSVMKVVIDMA